MCGEMASDLHAAVVLLGLGLDEFSMSAVSVPAVKKTIRAITRTDAIALAEEAMSLGTHREIEILLRDRLKTVIAVGD